MRKRSGLLSKTRDFIDEVFKVHFKGYDLRVMALFQKQQCCLSNKATTTCRLTTFLFLHFFFKFVILEIILPGAIGNF